MTGILFDGSEILCLANRARPDILTVTSFLCTRVQAPMQQAYEKLECVLGYLQGTVE